MKPQSLFRIWLMSQLFVWEKPHSFGMNSMLDVYALGLLLVDLSQNWTLYMDEEKSIQMRHTMIWSWFLKYLSIMLTFMWMVSSWLFTMFKCYTHVPWLWCTRSTTKENLENHSWKLAKFLAKSFILFTPPRSK
jgi:hypothetical protein